MQLKEYVTLVIEDIFEGIMALQAKYNTDQTVNAPIVSPSNIDSEGKTCYVASDGYCVNTINFEVSLLVEESMSKGKGGGVSLKIANFKADQDNASSSTVSQRVTFPIHVVYPSITTKREKKRVAF